MAGSSTPAVFITANVGSIFEEPATMLKIWTEEFLSTISRLDPKFVALHCQEVGGKNYEKSMQHVEDFVQLLVSSEELRLFDKVRIFLDEDYSSTENFTALGNFYFVHESITDALIYDFQTRSFVDAAGKEIHSHNIESVPTKEKSKFPLQYFPECKWSRKGFLRTRWSLNGTVFDLVNIHLFHDASNFVAIESFPSVYSDTRRRALAYTLERFEHDKHGAVPVFLFGDFNFRTDTQGVVKRLSEGLDSSEVEGKSSLVEYKEKEKVILCVGKKEFRHSDHQSLFTEMDGHWLRPFDKELEPFENALFEFDITFPPSYPFEENSTGDKCYMKTRCPAWCDRVLMTPAAVQLVKNSSKRDGMEYGLMGRSTCMGDHKPVYLRLEVKKDLAKDREKLKSEESTKSEVRSWIVDPDRFGVVKRVNSASVVENKPKKEDWKNTRCNSDVTWSPATSQVTRNWKGAKPLYRGNSKVRLISSSNSLTESLPRLTSHHSSSDEDWFEEVTDADDDVLKMKCDGSTDTLIPDMKQEFVVTSPEKLEFFVGSTPLDGTSHQEPPVPAPRKHKPSILKRLTNTKESQNQFLPDLSETSNRDSFENLVVNPKPTEKDNSFEKAEVNNQNQDKGTEKVRNKKCEVSDVWETIDLGSSANGEKNKTRPTKEKSKEKKKSSCCVLQ